MGTEVEFTAAEVRVQSMDRGAWFLWNNYLYMNLGYDMKCCRIHDQEIVTFGPDSKGVIVSVAKVIVRGAKQ